MLRCACLALVFAVLPLCAVSSSCDLQCFLSGLNISLPDVSFEGRALFKSYHLVFSSLHCFDVQVKRVSSSSFDPSTVFFSLNGVSFACAGSWTGQWFFDGEGTLEGTAEGSVDALQTLTASAFDLPQCNVTADCAVSVAGTAWIKDIFELFKRDLERHISVVLEQQMCALLQTVDRDYLSMLIRQLNAQIAAPVNVPDLPLVAEGTQLTNLMNSSIVGFLDFIFRREFGPDTLNRVFEIANVSSVQLPLHLHADFPVANSSSSIVGVLDTLAVSGKFDTWIVFSPMIPLSPAEFGFDASADGPFSLNITYRYNVTTATSVYNDAHGIFSVDFSNLTLSFRTLLLADGACFYNVSILQLLSTALVGSVSVTRIRETNATTSLELEFDALLDRMFSITVQHYSSNIWKVLDLLIVNTRVREHFNDFLKRQGLFCLNITDTPFDMELDTLAMIVSFSVWSAIAVALLVLVCVGPSCLGHRCPEALAFSDEVSLFARLLVVLLTVACFSCYNVTAASESSALVVRFFGVVTPVQYTDLPGSIAQAWNAGVYQMALVVVLFQVVVPYVKLLTISFAWFTPIKRCGRVSLWALTILDALQRFQLVAVFILVIYSISLHLYISNGAVSLESFIVVKMEFLMFASVTLVSGLVSSYVLFTVRRVCFARLDADADEHRSSKLLFWVVIVGLVAATGLFVAGLILTSFVLKIGGLGGHALATAGMPVDRSYSIVEMGEQLRQGWLDPSSAGAFALQISFFALVVALPSLQIIMCFVTWIWSSSLWCFFVLDFVSVWAALDVLLIAIASSLFSLPQYLKFLIGDRCDGIDAWLAHFVGPLLGSDKCITVTAEAHFGLYFVASACGLLFLLSRLILWQRFPFKNYNFDDEERSRLLIND